MLKQLILFIFSFFINYFLSPPIIYKGVMYDILMLVMIFLWKSIFSIFGGSTYPLNPPTYLCVGAQLFHLYFFSWAVYTPSHHWLTFAWGLHFFKNIFSIFGGSTYPLTPTYLCVGAQFFHLFFFPGAV